MKSRKEKVERRMKKAAILAAILTLATTFAVASPGRSDLNQRRGGRAPVARLAHRLNLTDAQKQQWRDIARNFREQNREFLQSFRQNRQDFRAARRAGDTAKADALKATLESQRAQMQQLRKSQLEQFSAVLTAEQRAQLDEIVAKRRGRQ